MGRLLTAERLEQRKLLYAPWQNSLIPCDVDDSGYVSSIDALLVINQLEGSRSGVLSDRGAESTEPYYDTNGDGSLSASDALLVINLLIRGAPSPLLTAGMTIDSDPNGNGVIQRNVAVVAGQTNPNWQVTLTAIANSAESLTTTADARGQYSLNIPLDPGLNEIEVSVRNALGESQSRGLSIVRGNILQEWNAAALNIVREWSTTSDDPYEGRIVTSEPPRVARNLAMIHGAMFDVLNNFAGSYESYLDPDPVPVDGVPEAAAAAAAHEVASALYSEEDEVAVWDATLRESLRHIDRDLTSSINYGRSIGNAFLTSRAGDGSDIEGTHTAGSDPGDWDRTAPDFIPPLLPAWVDVEPFALESADQFRPAPPPQLSTEQYANSVDEVLRLGGYNSSERTDEQTEIAIFWADGGGTFTPPGHWNQIASDAVSNQQLDLIDSARTFALLNYALADAGISAWDAKYSFDFWRPIDAIRNAESDGNPDTSPVSNWLPLIATPPFPTYTSGHSTFSGAAAEVLTQLFGDEYSFSSEIDQRPSAAQRPLPEDKIVTRHFTSFWHAAEEAGLSRIYGGIHFDFDNTAGLEAGRDVGAWVTSRLLQ